MKLFKRAPKPEQEEAGNDKPLSKRQQRKVEKQQQEEQAHAHFRKTQFILKSWKRSKDHVRVQPAIEDEDEIMTVDGQDKDGNWVRVLIIDKYAPVFRTGDWKLLNNMVRKEGAALRIKNRYTNSDVKFNMSMRYKLSRLIRSIDDATEIEPADPQEVLARETIVALRDSNTNEDARILEMYTMLIVSAQKKHQLEAAVNNLKSYFKNVTGKLNDLKREQGEALRLSSPVHGRLTSPAMFYDKHHKGHVTMDRIAARTYPMTHGSSRKYKGAYLGCRTEDGSFRFENLCDPNQPGAQNITVMGKTGEGKSFFMKALVLSLLNDGIRVFVFDLDGEWYDLCNEVGGIYIDQTTEEGKYFDPMVIMPRIEEMDHECVKYNKSRYKLAMRNTIRTFSMLAEGMTKPELQQLGLAIQEVFQQAGIHSSPEQQDTWNGPYSGPRPTIHRTFELLKERAADKTNSKRHNAESLVDKVEIYFDGVYSDVFGHEEQINFDVGAPMIVYRVGNGETGDEAVVDEDTKQAQLKLAMACDLVNAQIQRLKVEGVRFSAVVVDEGQRQIKNVELRRKIFDWYTSIRKWNGMMILGTNTPAIMLGSEEGKGMWQNTNIRVYFYMERAAIQSLQSESDVPAEIQDRIGQNEQTNRYILEYDKTFDELKMVVPERETRLYKTRGLRDAS